MFDNVALAGNDVLADVCQGSALVVFGWHCKHGYLTACHVKAINMIDKGLHVARDEKLSLAKSLCITDTST